MNTQQMPSQLMGDWCSQLTAAQLATARSIQLKGLTGRFRVSSFEWLKDGEIVAHSDSHTDVRAAFGEAVARLPGEFR